MLKFIDINWTLIEKTIFDWALNYSGLNPAQDEERIVWEEPNSPQPDPTYIGLKIISGPNKVGSFDDLRFNKKSTLTFDADFVTGNTIDLKINTVAMTQVPFNADQATTMQDIIDQIKADFPVIAEVTLSGRKLTFTHRTDNGTVAIGDVVIAGGASQAGSTISFDEFFTLAGLRTFTLSVKVYGKESMQFITNLLNSLERPVVIAAFRESQLALANDPDVTDLAALQETLFEARKVMDLIFNLGSNLDIGVPSETSVIEDTNIDGDLEGRNLEINIDT